LEDLSLSMLEEKAGLWDSGIAMAGKDTRFFPISVPKMQQDSGGRKVSIGSEKGKTDRNVTSFA
jgi:hypothetical protein